MAKKNPPAPPATDTPIVYLRSVADLRQLESDAEFLNELLDAHAVGDVDRAAKCVIAALPAMQDSNLADATVGLVHNMGVEEGRFPASYKKMLCLAVDFGLPEYAYNAANRLMDGPRSIRTYKKAEKYYKIAMGFNERPDLQAAAHVNYCVIIRDGLLSGTPDWPAAVEIYETAARMGLVKAMFNAANVSSWLAYRGDRTYGERAAYWLKYALDYRASHKPSLDMEPPAKLEEVFEQCMVLLSGLHIDARFDGAMLEEGIRWAREAAERGNDHARHNLGIGHIHRIRGMTTKPSKSPGGNWRSVLSQMDWRFKGRLRHESVSVPTSPVELETMKIDWLTVELDDGSQFPLFVTHSPCLPAFEGLDLLEFAARDLAKRHPGGFFLVSRRGYFVFHGEDSHTPIHVWQNGRLRMQTLWMGSSPEVVLQHTREGVEFLDSRFGTWTCMIPIAVNALDEGFVVAAHATPAQPWVGVGADWCLPYVDESQLYKLSIYIDTDEADPTRKRAYLVG